MPSGWNDFRHSFRRLIHNPSFTVIIALTLALGVGANTAIFSVVNGSLLRPLAYRDPDKLVSILHFYPSLNDLRAPVSASGFRIYRDQNRAFEGVAVETGQSLTLTGKGEPSRIVAALVSSEYFSTFGVSASIGRVLLPEEDSPGRDKVVVLGHGFWLREYGGSEAAVGSDMVLDGESHRIVGVLPSEFKSFSTRSADVWKPLALNPNQLAQGGGEFLQLTARVKPGLTLEQVESDVDALTRQVREEFPNRYPPDWRLTTTTLNELERGNVRPALLMLLGSVGFVLLIACANVASLLLARGAARQREIAVRQALGAGRWRLFRQHLTESLLLALAGGAIGLPLAYLSMKPFVMTTFAGLSERVAFDANVAFFTVAISVLAGLLAGVLPAVLATGANLVESLREGGRGATWDRRGHAVRHGLIVAEMALALVLLVGSGLLLKSFLRIQGVDTGFRVDHLLTGNIALPSKKYPSAAEQTAFYNEVLLRVGALPDVRSVGATSVLPFGGSWSTRSFRIEGLETPTGQIGPWGDIRVVTPGFLETLGAPLLKGRTFQDRDGPDTPKVAVIDDELARRYWPGQEPLGKRLSFGAGAPPGSEPEYIEIVGVVGHTMHEGLDADARIQLYISFRQYPRRFMTLAIRTAADPGSLAPTVRQAVLSLDANLPFSRVRVMEDLVEASLGSRRFSMLLLGVFSGVALLLSVVGIYGVMSYSVAQRTREMGVRLALGAKRGTVLLLVMRKSLTLALAGSVIGVAASLLLSNLIENQLYGIASTDLATFLTVPPLLVAAAVLATLKPALRATRVDPAITLRQE